MGWDETERLRDVKERFERSTFHTSFLGLRLDRVAPDEVTISLAVEPPHLNLVGTLHGGLVATLADTATGLAYRTGIDRGVTLVTTSLAVTFLAPGREGVVSATGRVIKRGSRFGYAEADVVDVTGALLARATATFAVVNDAVDRSSPRTRAQ